MTQLSKWRKHKIWHRLPDALCLLFGGDASYILIIILSMVIQQGHAKSLEKDASFSVDVSILRLRIGEDF